MRWHRRGSGMVRSGIRGLHLPAEIWPPDQELTVDAGGSVPNGLVNVLPGMLGLDLETQTVCANPSIIVGLAVVPAFQRAQAHPDGLELLDVGGGLQELDECVGTLGHGALDRIGRLPVLLRWVGALGNRVEGGRGWDAVGGGAAGRRGELVGIAGVAGPFALVIERLTANLNRDLWMCGGCWR